MQTPLKQRRIGLEQAVLSIVMETLCVASELERKAGQVIEVEVEVEEEEENEDEEEVEDDDNEETDHAEPQSGDTEEVESDTKEDSGSPKKIRLWEPKVYCATNKEQFNFVGHEISIRESLDSYGAVIWPGAVALCQYLDNNRQQFNLIDKSVLEVGAGTGLLSIVACLLGAWVTATDLPDLLGNLRCNLARNTKGRCKYTPQVAELCWEQDLEGTYPRSVYRYDYVLAADVVYHHDFLDELLLTMRHFCQPGTTLIWANKVRFQSDLRFTDNFKSTFHTTLLAELPSEGVKIFMATSRD
ncbi:hypothetical protein AAFF_G00193990 [Aldrovandia affinis]|uniref:Protein-lysine methyltransferase METTL21C n=1 Tax=Aldrovandia affinis TaxID=143900 RepID=A0AAD7SXE2_9TELE|nr:hypothetical protein AAFF_G00193990 [Aldrovandia affinis]